MSLCYKYLCTQVRRYIDVLFNFIQSVTLATEPDISLNNSNTNEDIATKCE